MHVTRPSDLAGGRSSYWINIAALAAAFFILAWGGVALTREAGRVSALWLPNAMLLVALLRGNGGKRAKLLACFGANLLANMASGDRPLLAAGLAFCNIVEVLAVLCALNRLSVTPADFLRPRQLLTFVGIAGLALPILTASMATLLFHLHGQAADAGVWTTYARAHGLGAVVATPVLLVLSDAWRSRHLLTRSQAMEAGAILGAVTIASVLIFIQSHSPLLFVVTPFILLAAFRLGVTGAACAMVVVALASGVGTTVGSGPIALVAGTISDKLTVLQLFLAISFASALPVASALGERERLAGALKRSEALLASITDNMRDVVFRADGQGRWSFLNPGWEQLTGTRIADSLGRPVTELIVPEDVDAARDKFLGLFTGEAVELQAQFRFHNASGETRWAETTIKRQQDDDGRVIGTIGSIQDITERQQQTLALAAREHELRLLTTHSADMIVRTGFDGVRRYVSPASRALLGYAPEEMVGRRPLSGIHPDDREAVEAVKQRMLDGADSASLVLRAKRRDGRYMWVEANYRLVRDEATGEPVEIVSVVRDFESRKQLEDALREARDEAEEAARLKTNFLANMSHEIRTPMNAVIGFTDLLLGSGLDEEQRRHANLIAESGRTMMALLNDILDLSKIDANQLEIADEVFDLPLAIAGSLRLVSANAAAKGLSLDLLIDPGVPRLAVGDGQRLRQVLLNLLSNAVKFTARGGVRVSACVLDDKLEIMVEDSGCGIAPDRQGAIFDEFVQADASIARRHGGSGLGLAISLRLARLMGGDLRLGKSDGQGTRMLLTLPLARAAPGAVAASHQEVSAPRPYPPSQSARVLVVEDVEVNRLLIRALLERQGHRVTLLGDGAETVDAFERAEAAGEGFDIVLMDMQMPQVDGLEATRRLRALGGRGATIPVVALTANAFASDVQACRDAGMDAHLAKPIDVEALLATIGQFMGASPTMPVQPAAPAEPVAPANPTPVEDPAIAALRSRYVALKATYRAQLVELADALRDAAAGSPPHAELAVICHKLAGSAGMFGEAAIGDLAHAIEEETKVGEHDDLSARAQLLADALAEAA